MIIRSGDEGQTVFDGENHTTFIKREKFGEAAISIKENAYEKNMHFQNFRWIRLTHNPFKDCWILLRWYFSLS